MDFWTLTDSARRRLRRAKGIAEALPEAPQHERWRRAHTLAEREIERYQECLHGVLVEAIAMLEANDGSVPSEAWHRLGLRLDRHMRRVCAATHCLHEWREPSDDVADLEGHRERGRRSPGSWRRVDEEDARDEEEAREEASEEDAERLTPEEFKEHFGHLPTDGEG
jgi:hypothetical protein